MDCKLSCRVVQVTPQISFKDINQLYWLIVEFLAVSPASENALHTPRHISSSMPSDSPSCCPISWLIVKCLAASSKIIWIQLHPRVPINTLRHCPSVDLSLVDCTFPAASVPSVSNSTASSRSMNTPWTASTDLEWHNPLPHCMSGETTKPTEE